MDPLASESSSPGSLAPLRFLGCRTIFFSILLSFPKINRKINNKYKCELILILIQVLIPIGIPIPIPIQLGSCSALWLGRGDYCYRVGALGWDLAWGLRLALAPNNLPF